MKHATGTILLTLTIAVLTSFIHEAVRSELMGGDEICADAWRKSER